MWKQENRPIGRAAFPVEGSDAVYVHPSVSDCSRILHRIHLVFVPGLRMQNQVVNIAFKCLS
jgi:hypothetical protein